MINGFDVQSANEVARKFRGLARRADRFGYSKEELVEQLVYFAENYEELADRIDKMMEEAA